MLSENEVISLFILFFFILDLILTYTVKIKNIDLKNHYYNLNKKVGFWKSTFIKIVALSYMMFDLLYMEETSRQILGVAIFYAIAMMQFLYGFMIAFLKKNKKKLKPQTIDTGPKIK